MANYIDKFKNVHMEEVTDINKRGIETATFGTGCFWCSEAIFQQLKGVLKVIPGFSGGKTNNPSYHEVCMGNSGYAEVCQIIYDTALISFDELLEVFWLIHDPTSLNRQGNDVGTQYRSAIFYHDENQMTSAQEYKDMLNASEAYPKPVITAISPFRSFYKAEEGHVNYYLLNGNSPYSVYVITPKIQLFRKVFSDKLKRPQIIH